MIAKPGVSSDGLRLPIIFFDGGCPLCRREIAHYRSLGRRSRLSWIDITRDQETLERFGLDFDQAMQRLYAVDERGEVQSGVAAFLVAWRHLPYYNRLAAGVQGLRLTPLLEWAYALFARWRLRSRTCSGGACAVGDGNRAVISQNR